MTRADLIGKMAEEAGITRAQADAALTALLAGVTDALARHEKVTLVGFGTFSVAQRAARTGRDPRTSGPIDIPASATARFKPGKGLKDALSG